MLQSNQIITSGIKTHIHNHPPTPFSHTRQIKFFGIWKIYIQTDHIKKKQYYLENLHYKWSWFVLLSVYKLFFYLHVYISYVCIWLEKKSKTYNKSLSLKSDWWFFSCKVKRRMSDSIEGLNNIIQKIYI